MRPFSRRTLALTFAVVVNLVATARAGDICCAHCGCSHDCQNVCRLVREEKKVTITCWGCLCEDFCIPGCSERGCRHCEEVCESCDECDPKSPHAEAKTFVWFDWLPGCAKGVHTKKKLMKKTVTKTVPSFKWVVEDVCTQCQARCQTAETPPQGAEIPPPPLAGAKVIYEH